MPALIWCRKHKLPMDNIYRYYILCDKLPMDNADHMLAQGHITMHALQRNIK